MTPVPLPALDGRDPLGFLAALGVLRLISDQYPTETRLSFSRDDATATLHSPLPEIQAIAQCLNDVVHQIPEEAAIPTATADFPRRRNGNGPDPMRVTPDQFPDLATTIADSDPTAADLWLSNLVTDLATDNQGRVAITPFTAPSGQQTLRTFFDKPLHAVRAEPSRIHEALTGWRRLDNFTGEYLDHRVLCGAADHPSGKSVEAGVPGATWLATMALPLLRLTGDGTRTATTLWHRHRRTHLMIWPIWTHPLDTAAIQVLLEHPALHPLLDHDEPTLLRPPLTALGVITARAARRQRIEGRNNSGVLTPTPLHLTNHQPSRFTL